MIPGKLFILKYENTHQRKYNQRQKFLNGFELNLGEWASVSGIANPVGRYLKNVFEKGIVEGVEEFKISANVVEGGILLCDLFSKSGLTSSNSEARRLINGGGAKLNNEKVNDEYYKITIADFRNNEIILSAGKKRYIKIIID